jgi:hypothetical protein
MKRPYRPPLLPRRIPRPFGLGCRKRPCRPKIRVINYRKAQLQKVKLRTANSIISCWTITVPWDPTDQQHDQKEEENDPKQTRRAIAPPSRIWISWNATGDEYHQQDQQQQSHCITSGIGRGLRATIRETQNAFQRLQKVLVD